MTAPRPRPVWCPHDTRRQPKPKLREWIFAPVLIFVAILSGLITAPNAKADGYLSTGETDYVTNYGYIICDTIAAHPTTAGVIGVLKGVMSTGGFTADNAVDVVNASVQGQCDEWFPLLQRIGRQARGEMAV